MSYNRITIGLALVALASTAAAQERGTVEFGAFGSAGKFNQSLTLDRGFGAGGHVGVYLDPRWAIEFEKAEMRATRTLGLKDVNVGMLSARLVATPIRSGALSIMIGAGGGASTETNFLHSYGVNALLGASIRVNEVVSLRVDAVADWLAHYDWKSNQKLQAGLVFRRTPTKLVRTVEVVTQAPAPACNCVDQPDSVSAAEQARRRQAAQDYRNLRDSLNRNPPAVSSESARATMEERIQFEFDKSDLTPAARAILDAKVAVFRANPTMTILISGHTGNMGTDDYNWALGTRRAESAKAYMVAQGIAASRIAIETKGESQQIVSPTAVGMTENIPNRRGMFRLIVVPDVIKKP
jgi:peptidoglycan-associated lipoprotein